MNSNEDDILARIRSGDGDAYALIVRKYQSTITRMIGFALPDHDSIAELVQQIFVEAYFALDHYDGSRPFGAWLRGIATNQLKNEFRRRSTKNRHYLRYRDHITRLLEGDELEDNADEWHEALALCREDLSEHAVELIELRYVRGLDFAEIALLTNRSSQSLRTALSRIRSTLRDCILGKVEQA